MDSNQSPDEQLQSKPSSHSAVDSGACRPAVPEVVCKEEPPDPPDAFSGSIRLAAITNIADAVIKDEPASELLCSENRAAASLNYPQNKSDGSAGIGTGTETRGSTEDGQPNNSNNKKGSIRSYAKIKRPEPFKCTRCHATFNNMAAAQYHAKVGHKSNEFSCEPRHLVKKNAKGTRICCRQCNFFHNVKMRGSEFQKSNPFSCLNCGTKFYCRVHMSRHYYSHKEGIDKEKCSKCDAIFTSIQCKDKHENSAHSDDRLHSCSSCDAKFRHLSNLKIHRKLHSTQAVYKCGQCEWAFSHPNNLKQHELIHSGDRPHKCHHCFASFDDPTHLKTHETVHAG